MNTAAREELLKSYDHVGPFSEGLAAARKGADWFHIYHNGTPAYEARYDEVTAFSRGQAMVRKGGDWFYIRPDGTRVR